MSQNKGNHGREDKPRFDVGLTGVCSFLHFIWVAAGAFLIVSLLGLLLFTPNAASKVAYQLTAGCCAVTAAGGWLACRLLDKKDKELQLREREAQGNHQLKKGGGK